MVIYGSLGWDKLSQESCCSVYWTACQTKTLSLLTFFFIKLFFYILFKCIYLISHFVDLYLYCCIFNHAPSLLAWFPQSMRMARASTTKLLPPADVCPIALKSLSSSSSSSTAPNVGRPARLKLPAQTGLGWAELGWAGLGWAGLGWTTQRRIFKWKCF